MTNEEENQLWLDWRDVQRSRRRVMTAGEYLAWTRGGDAISYSTDANAFPGGLTIDFRTPAIIGRFEDES